MKNGSRIFEAPASPPSAESKLILENRELIYQLEQAQSQINVLKLCVDGLTQCAGTVDRIAQKMSKAIDRLADRVVMLESELAGENYLRIGRREEIIKWAYIEEPNSAEQKTTKEPQ